MKDSCEDLHIYIYIFILINYMQFLWYFSAQILQGNRNQIIQYKKVLYKHRKYLGSLF